MLTPTRRLSLLALAAVAHAFPFPAPLQLDLVSGSRTNDVICQMADYQQAPPVVSA
jgi:hypothetical protein